LLLITVGYVSPHHSAGSAGVPAPGPVAPLQQQLEHASQKAGFVDDKYKPRQQVRRLLPLYKNTCISLLVRIHYQLHKHVSEYVIFSSFLKSILPVLHVG